jgi:cobalt-zinc-cadmium efflux system outer membrane protein
MDRNLPGGALARLTAVAGIASIAAWSAHAEPAPPFPALFKQAEVAVPRLAEARARVLAAQGTSVQAAARPNPTLDLLAENLGGGTASNGVSLEQTTLSVNQPLEIGGQRSARIAAASAGVNAARAELQQAISDFAYDLATAYVAAELASARQELARQTLDRALEDQRAAQALVNAGREAELRVVQANAATAAAQADVENAQAEAQAALARLSGLAATQPFTSIGRMLLDEANMLSPPPLQSPVISPAVRTAEAQRDTAAQRITVERTRTIPDVTLSLGVRQFGGENAKAVVAGIGVPLPLFDNNRGAIAAAEAELAAANARVDTARLSAEADWRSAALQALAAGRSLAAASEAERAADEAYRLARIGYDAGRTPLIEVLTARQNSTEAQLRTLDARAARLRAETTLARLTGGIPFGGNP